ncbi:hypothetical protein PO909_015850 [Leuciscus waleckii]
MLGHMASAAAVLQLGLLRMRPLQRWLKARAPRRAWIAGGSRVSVNQGCVSALQPWLAAEWYQRGVTVGVISHRKTISTDASNLGWGAFLEGRPVYGLWSDREKCLHINCLEMLAVENALKHFLPYLRGHHVLARTDNMSVVSYVNRQGGIRSKILCALAERLLVWAQGSLRSLRAAHVPGHLNVGPDRLSRDNVPPGEWSLHHQTVQLLWHLFGRAKVDLFAADDNAHCPIFFSKSEDALAQAWPSLPLYAFSPDLAVTPGDREDQRKAPLSAPHSPALGEPDMVPGINAAGRLSPMADPGAAGRGQAPSTLKVYVAAIAAFADSARGRALGRNEFIIRFLKGARRMNPPRPPSVPIWDLSLVLEALKAYPFEPLDTVDLKYLTFKTVFLIALSSVKRVGDLHALSVNAACLEFGPNDSIVILKPRHGYVPKVMGTPFRAQVISLSALPASGSEVDSNLLCPVRALRNYVTRSAAFRRSEQLFVSFGGRTKGLAASKHSLSRWIVDAIAAAYASRNLQCPLGIRAHSTGGMASSWAWSSGISIHDICTAAGWASPSTFVREKLETTTKQFGSKNCMGLDWDTNSALAFWPRLAHYDQNTTPLWMPLNMYTLRKKGAFTTEMAIVNFIFAADTNRKH